MARTKQTVRKSTGGKLPAASKRAKSKPLQPDREKIVLPIPFVNMDLRMLNLQLKQRNILKKNIKGTGTDGAVLKIDKIKYLENYVEKYEEFEYPEERKLFEETKTSRSKSKTDKQKVALKESKPSKSKKVQKYDKITLVFEYDKGKPINFVTRIEKGDYETFYGMVSDFFVNELDESQVKQINKLYPKFKVDEDDTFRTVFDRDFVVGGVEGIGRRKYKISWAT